MILKYDKLYFLHIRKTGGRYITESAILPIQDQLNQHGVEIIFDDNSHAGWHSRIDNNTYVISSLRDPVEQTISLYIDKLFIKLKKENKNNYTKNELTPKSFFNQMENLALYPNFQTKNFLFDESFNNFKLKISIDEELVKTRREKVNLFLNAKNIKDRATQIQQKIFIDLGIDGTPVHVDIHDNFYNPESTKLYNSLSKKEVDLIRKYNSVDDYFYKNTLYF
jgi:hypothetical protein